MCPPLNKIERVNTTCAIGPTPVVGMCVLYCDQEGLQLRSELYENLVCLPSNGSGQEPGWYPRPKPDSDPNKEISKVTVEDLRNLDLCNTENCPIISGIDGVSANCSERPSTLGQVCRLECENKDREFTEKDYTLLVCKTIEASSGDDALKTEWHTMSNRIATLNELKILDPCELTGSGGEETTTPDTTDGETTTPGTTDGETTTSDTTDGETTTSDTTDGGGDTTMPSTTASTSDLTIEWKYRMEGNENKACAEVISKYYT